MTHTLCDSCQTFEFQPGDNGVAIIRRAPQPMLTRKGWKPGKLIVTGQFQMTRDEARNFWRMLVRDGAYRV